MNDILHLYKSNCSLMIDFRQNVFFICILFCLSISSACGDDDEGMMSVCPPPVDAFIMSDCLLEIPDMLRSADDPNETYSVDLYNDNGDYYYAFKPAAINNTKLEVYDACCNYICRIGFPITEECDWRDTAEELGTIWEE